MKHIYKDNKEYMENLERPEVRDTIATMVQNRKVMQWLKVKLLGKEMVERGTLMTMDTIININQKESDLSDSFDILFSMTKKLPPKSFLVLHAMKSLVSLRMEHSR